MYPFVLQTRGRFRHRMSAHPLVANRVDGAASGTACAPRVRTSHRGKGVGMNRIKRLCFAASALAAVLFAGGASWRL
jgi:hypothetical protein